MTRVLDVLLALVVGALLVGVLCLMVLVGASDWVLLNVPGVQ